jgi:hypothetical protein
MLRIIIPLCSFFVVAQQPLFDGYVSTQEWKDAQQFSIPYEIKPSDNGPAHYKTEVFVHKVGNDLFVGSSQRYREGENAGKLDIDSSQLYFKFQYLFEI